jgi:hypothetical protein
MADVADYRVISDAGVTLETGGDIDHTFRFDLGTAVKHTQPVILQCLYETRNTELLMFRLVLNGSGMKQITVRGEAIATMHAVQDNVTRPGLNELTVEIREGTGRVKISDIVLFVQREA